MTKRLAIIGDPIGHSLSPAMYNAVFPAMGIDAVYEAWLTPREDVSAAIEKLRSDEMMGMNVTVPHKEAVLGLLDAIDPAARTIGAVNCIVKRDARLVGYNTDKAGFIDSLRNGGFDPADSNVLVLGAGGSARAVCVGLVEAGAARVIVAGRRREPVDALIGDLQRAFPKAHFQGCSMESDDLNAATVASHLVVNCTPVGMEGTGMVDQSPLPAEVLRPGLWVCDLVYRPLETRLLRDAADSGASTIGGLEMLVLQAVESVRLWTGREPPVEVMRKAARDALGLP